MTKATKTATRSAHLKWVPLEEIVIPDHAQREFRPSWAKELLGRFDLDKLQVPHVSHRDGAYYMVDGQHGTWAYKEWIGDWQGQKIQCWVHEGLTPEQESDLFLSLNNKKQVDAFEKFTVAVNAGYETESDVDRIVRANGCVVSRAALPGAIRAVGALMNVYRQQSPEVLGLTIRVIRDAYGDAGYESQIIDGLGALLGRHSLIDQVRLVRQLHNAAGGSKGLLNRAQAMREGNGQTKKSCVAAVAVDTYNQGLAPRSKKRLPSWWRDVEGEAAA